MHVEVAGKAVVERPDGPGRHLVGIKVDVDPAADRPIGKDFLALQELFDLWEAARHFPADVGEEPAVAGGCSKRFGH